jgi:hypothetical protein
MDMKGEKGEIEEIEEEDKAILTKTIEIIGIEILIEVILNLMMTIQGITIIKKKINILIKIIIIIIILDKMKKRKSQ